MSKEAAAFLKKAAQKLLASLGPGVATSTAQFKKVFCFFSSKKKPSPALNRRRRPRCARWCPAGSSIGHGGFFGCIYSVRGAGGYQMIGITPMPIYDPQQQISYLREFMILFRPGDMVQFKPIDRAGYEQIADDVAYGRFAPRIRPVTFELDAFNADPASYAGRLKEALGGD
jgi:hypothetical protein